MTIISAPEQFNTERLFVDLSSVLGHSLHLKVEGFNFAGSVKLKAASRGYEFVCVTDNRCNLATTGPAIAAEFGTPGRAVDVVFVGAGTTGTLMGVARYFADHHPGVRVVAVDAVGSVTFGGPAAPRMIQGLGTSVRPAHTDESYLADVVYVEETDTIRACHSLTARGFLFGGSTGTVISGAAAWLAENDPEGTLTSVALAPDMGERYLDTVYQTNWVEDLYGADALNPTAAVVAVPGVVGLPVAA